MPSPARLALVVVLVLGLIGISAPATPPADAYAGALDPSLGVGGVSVLDARQGPDWASAVVRHTAGALVTAGRAEKGQGGVDVALARIRSDGSLDPAFGTQGRVLTSANISRIERVGLAAHADGRLVAVISHDSREHLLVFAYLPDGRPDPAFGTGGRAEVTLPPGAKASPWSTSRRRARTEDP